MASNKSILDQIKEPRCRMHLRNCVTFPPKQTASHTSKVQFHSLVEQDTNDLLTTKAFGERRAKIKYVYHSYLRH